MKKLMMLGAVLASAVAVQAAQVDWQVNKNGTVGYGGSAKAMPVYLLDANKMADVVVAITTAGFDWQDSSKVLAVAGVYDKMDSSTSGNAKHSQVNVTKTGGSLGDVWSWQALIFDTDAEGKAYYKISAVKTAKLYQTGDEDYGTPQVAQFTATNFGATSTGWKEMSSVPEPTSGLLLLLGVAGLALRRRRA